MRPVVPGALIRRDSRIATITHELSHRRYQFRVFRAAPKDEIPSNGTNRVWLSLGELDRYPLPSPHLKIAAMLSKPCF